MLDVERFLQLLADDGWKLSHLTFEVSFKIISIFWRGVIDMLALSDVFSFVLRFLFVKKCNGFFLIWHWPFSDPMTISIFRLFASQSIFCRNSFHSDFFVCV